VAKQPPLSAEATQELLEYAALQGETGAGAWFGTTNTTSPYDFLYPTLNDPNFSAKIARKKEFGDFQYDGEIRDIRQYSNTLCNASFELAPHQMFVKNFMSFETPYNSLLLYHSLGSGKTQSAIGITEEMRDYMKQTGLTQKIIIVASPNVQGNFRKELFNEARLTETNGLWTIGTPIGDKFLREINPTNIRNIPRAKIVSQINAIINTFYVFMGYIEFSHYIDRKTGAAKGGAEEIQQIRRLFNNRLVVIDEVHNIRITEENKKKTTGLGLFKLANYAENMRLLLLSATPMYNSYKEIIWLVNLMNLNDKRPVIKQAQVWRGGDFLPPSGGREGGRELLARKLIGYVSYVRGENPYTFPFRLYPRDFSTPEHYFAAGGGAAGGEAYPRVQMNGKAITEPIQYIQVYLTPIGEFQEQGYQTILNSVKSKFTEEDFENKEGFGYNLLQAPLEALNIIYPTRGASPSNTQSTTSFVVGGDNGSDNDSELDGDGVLEGLAPLENALHMGINRRAIGKRGLETVMEWTEDKTALEKYNYRYRGAPNIFGREHIANHSHKIAAICNIIQSGAKGIILVYSNYIDGGIVPMALALEEMGFTRFGSTMGTRSLFAEPPTENIDAVTMLPRSAAAAAAEASVFQPAKYVMITGDKYFSKNNAEDLKYIVHPNNKFGEKIKVVLISRSGAEGLDFKNLRQIHILDSWYNMSRIEQIIGRGVRNLGHCSLPFEERNVEIYLHATLLHDRTIEAIDLYLYRFAEKKAVQIGKITRILKEISVDCHLNLGQANLTVENMRTIAANQKIQIRPSSWGGVGGDASRMLKFIVGDKPMTEMCDFMNNCQYHCAGAVVFPDTIGTDTRTYNENFLDTNRDKIFTRIRQLYRDQAVYRRADLIAGINIVKKYPLEQIYSALTSFLQEHEYLADKRGRYGYMINRGEYYLFQPTEITDKNATIYERTAPVDYKRERLSIEPPIARDEDLDEDTGEDTGDTDDEDDENFIKKMEKVVEDELNQQPVDAAPAPHSAVAPQQYEFLNLFHQQYNIYINTKINTTLNDRDWFIHAKIITPLMQLFHNITAQTCQQYVIQHIVDIFPYKLPLITWHAAQINAPPDNVFERAVFDYIGTKTITPHDAPLGYLISDGNAWKMYSLEGTGNVPEIATKEEIDVYIKELVRTRQIYKKENGDYNNIIGFINLFKEKGDPEMVFKIKHMDQARNNKGNTCVSSGQKGDLLKDLNKILDGEKIYPNAPTTKMVKYGFCCITEFLLRHNQAARKNGKIWFLTPELAALNRVKDI
jgi:hypothetical protein